MGRSAEALVREAFQRIADHETAQDLLAPHFVLVGALSSGPAKPYDGQGAGRLLREQEANVRLLRTTALPDGRVYVELAMALNVTGTPGAPRSGHLVAGICEVGNGLITSAHLSIDVPAVRADAGLPSPGA